MKNKKHMLSLDEFVGKLNKPVKSTTNGLESPMEKINRMFKYATDKLPEKTDDLKKEWAKMKEKQLAGDISNLEYQIKEVLSRYNIAFLSESQEEVQEIPGNRYNEKAKAIKEWLRKNIHRYNTETQHIKMIEDILKEFNMSDKSSTERDDFIQIININLE